MYKVIKFFTDLQDNNYPYNAGDNYPRYGYLPSADRIEELMGSDNKQGVPLIQLVEETAEEKPKKKRAKKTAEA
jgi:hypothetical protein